MPLPYDSTSYREYLNSPAWRKRRRSIVRRSCGCAICKTTRHLCVHHLHYKTIGSESNEDVMVVCRLCHGRIHAWLDKEYGESCSTSEKIRHTLEAVQALFSMPLSELPQVKLSKSQLERRKKKGTVPLAPKRGHKYYEACVRDMLASGQGTPKSQLDTLMKATKNSRRKRTADAPAVPPTYTKTKPTGGSPLRKFLRPQK